MKFSCTQENLATGLALVSRVASKHANLPILQNVLIKAETSGLSLLATNLETGIEAKIRGKTDQTGSFTVPANLFQNYVGLLPSGRIDVLLEGKELRITAEGHNSKIKGEEAADFPLLPVVEQNNVITCQRSELVTALQQVIVAAAIDESRPEIAGVYWWCQPTTPTKLILAATDSYRLAETHVTLTKEFNGDFKTILPQRSAMELLRLLQTCTEAETVDCCVTEGQFACWCGEVMFVSRVVQGHFPDYEQIIPQQGKTTARLPQQELIAAVKGTALFSKTGVNDIDCSFHPENNTVELRATNAQLGENVTRLTGEITGESLTMTLNYRFLLDAITHIAGTKIEFMASDRNSPGLFRSADRSLPFLYIIMPIKQ